MEMKKIVSALCYFSMLFAGFIFPFVVFLVADDTSTRSHTKRAFISHLIPLILAPILAAAIFYDIAHDNGAFPIHAISCVAFIVIISITVLIWNIVNGVKVLLQK